jgi:hypothetical protein
MAKWACNTFDDPCLIHAHRTVAALRNMWASTLYVTVALLAATAVTVADAVSAEPHGAGANPSRRRVR